MGSYIVGGVTASTITRCAIPANLPAKEIKLPVWEVGDSDPIKHLIGSFKTIYSIKTFSHDQIPLVFAASNDHNVHAWRLDDESTAPFQTYSGALNGLKTVDVIETESRLEVVAAGYGEVDAGKRENAEILIWDINGTMKKRIKVNSTLVEKLKYDSQTNSVFYLSFDDNKIHKVDLESYDESVLTTGALNLRYTMFDLFYGNGRTRVAAYDSTTESVAVYDAKTATVNFGFARRDTKHIKGFGNYILVGSDESGMAMISSDYHVVNVPKLGMKIEALDIAAIDDKIMIFASDFGDKDGSRVLSLDLDSEHIREYKNPERKRLTDIGVCVTK